MTKKRTKAVALVLLASWVGWMCLGPYDWYCYRCGAIKTGCFIASVRPTDTTRWLEAMGVGPCSHRWMVDSYVMGNVDCFVSMLIPVMELHGVGAEAVDALPREEWKHDIVWAVTDENNKLRWAPVVLMAQEVPLRQRSAEEWQAWHQRYRHVFSAEPDATIAHEKARAILESMLAEYGPRDDWKAGWVIPPLSTD